MPTACLPQGQGHMAMSESQTRAEGHTSICTLFSVAELVRRISRGSEPIESTFLIHHSGQLSGKGDNKKEQGGGRQF